MPKTKVQKEEALKIAKEKLGNSTLAVFTSYKNLPFTEVEKIRKELKEANVFYKVLKKTIFKLATDNQVDNSLIENIDGNLTVAFGEDEVSAAKILAKFAKENENLEIHGGWLEDKFINKEQVEELSKLLSKEELLGQFIRTLKSPISGFANVLAGNTRGLVNVLKAIADKK